MSLTLPADDAALARAARKLVSSAGARLGGRYHGPDPAVRRHSYDVDDPQAQVAQRLADGTKEGTLSFIDALVRTAQEFDDRQRGRGENRPLGLSGIRVLDAVLRNHWHDFRTGNIDPAISQIMKAITMTRGTVVKALANLDRHGFLSWVRRTVKVDNPVPGGPTRQQTTNAYFVEVGRLASDVRQRFLQLWTNAKARLVLRRKSAPSGTAKPAPAPKSPTCSPALQAALAALGRGVEGRAPSPVIGQSPGSGGKR